MELNRAPGQESTLLRRSLTSSRDSVLVPTLPGKQIQLPPIVMRVRSGSFFSGCTSHTTMVWQISSRLWHGCRVVDKEEGVSARNLFCVGRRSRAYALA
jgi:hypothetical protein